ncbi:hypothetical protein HMPREF9080_02303 [Cardiobacterium valvarum F0432]|uniref:Uncharacterized protein n=1 Tax=Cardiobacterium valvarum F0432 TaxID=797473 RepID=G9ZHP5_9GAMM|nr:hypothetical protein HMPREF9080_02303 [Cardiobacterium valvarum F0432]
MALRDVAMKPVTTPLDGPSVYAAWRCFYPLSRLQKAGCVCSVG